MRALSALLIVSVWVASAGAEETQAVSAAPPPTVEPADEAAQAQAEAQASVPMPVPAPIVVQPVPVVVCPPTIIYWMPQQPDVASSADDEADAIEHAARKRLFTADTLIGVGTTLAFAGIALLFVDAPSHDFMSCGGGRNTHHGHDDCDGSALAIISGLTMAVGVGLFVPAGILRDEADRELTRARHLRRGAPEWSLRPRLGTHGAGAELAVRF
jgi:hypothetical protein